MKHHRDTVAAALFFAALLLGVWLVCQLLFPTYIQMTGDEGEPVYSTKEGGNAASLNETVRESEELYATPPA